MNYRIFAVAAVVAAVFSLTPEVASAQVIKVQQVTKVTRV